MESSSSAVKTITIQELLQRQSPLSAHHHFSLKGGPGDLDRLSPYQTDPSSSSIEREGSFSRAAENSERVKPQCILSSETLGAQYVTGHVLSTGIKNQQMLGPKPSHLRSQADLLHLSEEPLVLLGWIQLWNGSPYEAYCLAFSDISGTICCALTEFDPQLLGCPVRLLSWSYIPQREKVGCLEIRHFAPMETSKNLACRSVYVCPESANVPNLVLETPPSKQNLKALRHTLTGCVNFISPPFSIPHGERRLKRASERSTLMVSKDTNSAFCIKKARTPMHSIEASNLSSSKLQHVATSIIKEKPLLGFFVGLSFCNHKPGCLPPRLDHCGVVENGAGNEDHEPYKQCMFYVYFSGSIIAWRPLLLTIAGKCVVLTKLRKKILVAREAGIRYGIYAATRISSVLLCYLSHTEKFKSRESDGILQIKSSVFSKACSNQQDMQCLWQKNDVGSYVGIVTEIFVRGGLLELDGCVWLLLTHQPLSHIHGLRVGATITAFHVHFVRVTSFLEKGLMLAACSISHVVVTQFSPLQTESAGKQKSESGLIHLVESLPFLSTFWALQVIASFRRKFRTFFTEKELLGSSKNMGMAEKYLRDTLSANDIHCRNVFGEFFSHSTSCLLAKSVPFKLSMQVPPIKNFCKQIQMMWRDRSSWLWNRQDKPINGDIEILDYRQKGNVFIRRVISGDILGLTILGFLQFSSMLGRLQLLDATGAVDVLIPDLHTAETTQGAYQVTSYKLVIEGYLEAPLDHNVDLRWLPLSWYNLLKGTSCSLEASEHFSFFLIFSIKEAHMVPYIRRLDFAQSPTRKSEAQLPSPIFKTVKEETCIFDLLLVVHKHPARIKSLGKQTGDCSFTFCVEAVKLPYRICIFNKQRKPFEAEDAAGIQNSCACTISVLSLPNFFDMSHKGTDRRGYSSYPCLLTKSFSAKVERLLFQFTDTYQAAFPVIEIGQLYLVQSLQDHAVRTMHSGSSFWSLLASDDCVRSAIADKMQKKVLGENGLSFPLVDVILKLPRAAQSEFNSSVKDARVLLSPISSIKEVINHGKSLIYSEHVNDRGALKGSLLSLYGMIGSFDTEQIFPFFNPYTSAGEDEKRLITFTLKDLNSSESIMVACNFDQHRPVGFGPGAVVAIYRALLHLSADGKAIIKCIPSTLIEVSCVGEDSFLRKSSCFKELHSDQDECKTEHTTIASILLSTCINSFVPKSFKICCRVVSVERLLLERNEMVNTCVLSLEAAFYKVRFVTLTVDDGSGLARCSAQDEAAASLLNIPVQNSNKIWRTFENMDLIKQLNDIVVKYKEVVYCSIDPQHDSSSNSFMVHGAEGQALDSAENKFMHAIVVGACHVGPMDVVAEVWFQENVGSGVWQGQQKDMQIARKASGPFLLAKKVGVIRYETQMNLICKDLENTLKKSKV